MKLLLNEMLSRRLVPFLKPEFPGSTEPIRSGSNIWMIEPSAATRTDHVKSLAVPPAPFQGIPVRITFRQRGFTLIELAIVLFVVALLLGGMLLPLAAQQDIRNYGDTQKILVEARDALLGFAVANDRLPCPAANAATGSRKSGGRWRLHQPL